MKPRHFFWIALAVVLLLFLFQNFDLWDREKMLRLRWLAWHADLRTGTVVLALPLLGFLAGYLARVLREVSKKRAALEARAKTGLEGEELPRLPRATVPAPGAEEVRP